MPPPRLPRHLRPCHPPGTAHHVRCASKIARRRFARDRDNAAQSVSSAGDPPEPSDRRSWWRKVKSSIDSFASKPSSAEPTAPGPQSSNAPIAPLPLHHDSTVRKVDEQAQGNRGGNRGEAIQGEHARERVLEPAERTWSRRDSSQESPRMPVKKQLAGTEQRMIIRRLITNKGGHGKPVQRLASEALGGNGNRKGEWLENSPAVRGAQQRDGLSIAQRACSVYRDSTLCLIHALETTNSISPRLAAPIAISIASRLRVIALDAIIENDSEMLGELTSAIRSLPAELNYLLSNSGGVDGRPRSTHAVAGTLALETKAGGSNSFSPVVPLSETKEDTKPSKVSFGPLEPGSDVVDQQADILNMDANSGESVSGRRAREDRQADDKQAEIETFKTNNDDQSLIRQIHTQSRSMNSSDHPKVGTPTTTTPSNPPPQHDEVSEQSLLEELFPEVSTRPQPRQSEPRDQYPKLHLPDSPPTIRRVPAEREKTLKEQVVRSFQQKGEQITVLQLAYCSTELTEADFRRLIPKGKHIDSWSREGEFYKVFPGRDPLSLERLPLYYILFKDPESALAYQKNVSRLHKLSALHQPSNIFSAIPPPKGFLEDGEDINSATSLYNLLPTHHHFSLNTLMQPYNPALRALIERGGYQPIMPDVDSAGNKIWKVLMHIEGYEPSLSDLFKIFRRDAYKNGMLLTLRNESSTSIHRLRDMINLKTHAKPMSSVQPRAYGTFDHDTEKSNFEDPSIQSFMGSAEEDSTAKEVNQMVINRLYNRWIIDFSDEAAARRFAVAWHRRVLPDLVKDRSWKDAEERRICNTEVLW
ncbi:hypothetical protein N0V83_001721 [Neocucurbitaria cava]|uniref:Uncharacterized protein n=1 Tax=Neocucurbitaria cava TaxID=798079 RepID=A0A9W8YGT3_9PLEO|nr:hypothetical protein N0V83_001721 [Neocucurbitaria cava]